MVVLNRKQLLHQNLYFGKKQAKGSKRKVLDLQGIGLYPLGSGMYTLGESGKGMTLLGTGLLQKLKMLASPLLKIGKKIAIDSAMSQLSKIKQPELRSLAKKGLETAESGDIERALKGNDKLGNLAKLATSGIQSSTPELTRLAQKGLRRGVKKVRGRGMDGQPMLDEVANVSDRKLKKDSQNVTQDNRQLTLLKDIIRSKPIKTMSNRAGGLQGSGMTPL